jgi:hypothetical protein
VIPVLARKEKKELNEQNKKKRTVTPISLRRLTAAIRLQQKGNNIVSFLKKKKKMFATASIINTLCNNF